MMLAFHLPLFFGMSSCSQSTKFSPPKPNQAPQHYIRNLHRDGGCVRRLSMIHAAHPPGDSDGLDFTSYNSAFDEKDQSRTPSQQVELEVLRLAQSHFVAQALVATLRIGVLDVLEVALDDTNDASSTVDEILTNIKCTEAQGPTAINRDALFRCLRLLCTSGVVKETTKSINDTTESAFLLTEMGQRLQQQKPNSNVPSMAPFVLHWAELPIWDAWAQLPDFVAGKPASQHSLPVESDESHPLFDSNIPPFDRTNGMSASDYYRNNASSCSHRNAVARYASSTEITSILNAMQSSSTLNKSILAGKTIVDIGGGYGDLMYAVKAAMPSVSCYCLDLPDVISDATSTENDNENEAAATLIPGDMFDSSTIPACDLIVTKHVLCDFPDDDVVLALQSFEKSLSKGGKVVIMDAVLPNGDELNGKWNPAVSFDVLLMLTGRRAERSQLEWSNLAERAGFVLEDVLPTASVTVDLAILSLA